MKSNILTDVELRAHWFRTHATTYTVAAGTILTPAARDFLKERNIALVYGNVTPESSQKMSMRPIPFRNGRPVYVDAATGKEMTNKPEEMTHLRGNLLVSKTHPRIAFRGQLDSLQAQIIALQVWAKCEGEQAASMDLGELLGFCRALLGAEVKDEPLPEFHILGLDSTGLRRCSHQVKDTFGIDHPVPSHEMGSLCAGLNLLRTQVREVELSAARAFERPDGGFERTDIIEGLNRLSSAVYIIFCRQVSGWYQKQGGKSR